MALRLFRLCSNGPATNVEVLDMLPSGVQFNSQQATHGGYNSTTGIWNLAAPLFQVKSKSSCSRERPRATESGGAVSEPLSQPVYD
jgi:hypothetical protein